MPTRYPPIDLEISSSLLPYTDLDIKGDPKRNLRIPADVILALAGIYGIQSNGLPRMAQMSPSGALYVSEAGGGSNDVMAYYGTLPSGNTQNINFGRLAASVYLRATGATFTCVSQDSWSFQMPFQVAAGLQVVLPITVQRLQVINGDLVSGSYEVMGFVNNPNAPTIL